MLLPRKEHQLLRCLFLCVVFAVLFSGVPGCISKSVETWAPPNAAQDSEYEPVLTKWTRKVTVFSQFQNRVELGAVLLTNEMRRAVTQRLSRLRGSADTLSVLSDSSGGVRLGILVSVFTPESAYTSLDDRTLWTLSMRIGPSQLNPMYVRYISDKTLLQTFFPTAHQWTRDYLLVFDFPETVLQRDNDLQKDSLAAELLAQSALAKVQLRWP